MPRLRTRLQFPDSKRAGNKSTVLLQRLGKVTRALKLRFFDKFEFSAWRFETVTVFVTISQWVTSLARLLSPTRVLTQCAGRISQYHGDSRSYST